MITPNMSSKTGSSNTLFSGVQQRVLGLIFGNPDRSFHQNELVRLTSSGSGAIQREIKRLEESGLITTTEYGNQKRYQANQNAPIYAELRGIVVKTFGIADQLRQALLSLSDAIRAAFIYGSIAKASEKASSDIDVMVIADNVSYPEIFNSLSPLEVTLGRKINPNIYTAEEFERKVMEENAFLTRVLLQPKIYLIGSDDALPKPGKPGQDRQAEKGTA